VVTVLKNNDPLTNSLIEAGMHEHTANVIVFMVRNDGPKTAKEIEKGARLAQAQAAKVLKSLCKEKILHRDYVRDSRNRKIPIYFLEDNIFGIIRELARQEYDRHEKTIQAIHDCVEVAGSSLNIVAQ